MSSEAPSAKDVQWLSDGYDEVHSANGRAEESLTSIEYGLQQMVDKVSWISKAVDEIQLYSTVARKGHYNIFSRDNFNLSRDKFKLSRDNFELSRDN